MVSYSSMVTSHGLEISQKANNNMLFPVLPRFDVKINAPDEISIIQEEFEAEVCAK